MNIEVENLIGRQVTAVSDSIGNKVVTGKLFLSEYTSVAKFSVHTKDTGDGPRTIPVLTNSIEPVPEKEPVNEHALCFNETEAEFILELAASGIPSWQAGNYVNYISHMLTEEEAVSYLLKLKLINVKVEMQEQGLTEE